MRSTLLPQIIAVSVWVGKGTGGDQFYSPEGFVSKVEVFLNVKLCIEIYAAVQEDGIVFGHSKPSSSSPCLPQFKSVTMGSVIRRQLPVSSPELHDAILEYRLMRGSHDTLLVGPKGFRKRAYLILSARQTVRRRGVIFKAVASFACQMI